jgi:hypothetical protein
MKDKKPNDQKPYNPLEKRHLGISVAEALLECPISPLPPEKKFSGAGVYAIYYTGNFPPYASLSRKNINTKFLLPIYVGKAVPAGARKGGLGLDIPAGQVLFNRLAEHADSITQSENLNLKHFHCRYLITDDIWIPLGESLLIEMFRPPWNIVLDGFGNHDPGKGRYKQQRSPWDMIHPGRSWARKCEPNLKTASEILAEAKKAIVKNTKKVIAKNSVCLD